jgi:hypothetical protein
MLMSATTTVRIPTAVVARLRELADERQASVGDVVADLVSRFDEERFWSEVNAGYARLRADPVASAAYDTEVAAWDGTLLDGLDEDDAWGE